MTSREGLWTNTDLLSKSKSPLASSVEYQSQRKDWKSKAEFLEQILTHCCPRPMILCVEVAENFKHHPETQNNLKTRKTLFGNILPD